jgi:hypothetical protein
MTMICSDFHSELCFVTGLITEKLRSNQLISFVRPLEAVNSTAVRVSWEIRGKIPTRNIDGFRIRYRVSPDLDQIAGGSSPGAADTYLEETVNDGRTTSYIVGGLSRYTYYEFRIQPIVQGALGLESAPATVRTHEDGKQL